MYRQDPLLQHHRPFHSHHKRRGRSIAEALPHTTFELLVPEKEPAAEVKGQRGGLGTERAAGEGSNASPQRGLGRASPPV